MCCFSSSLLSLLSWLLHKCLCAYGYIFATSTVADFVWFRLLFGAVLLLVFYYVDLIGRDAPQCVNTYRGLCFAALLTHYSQQQQPAKRARHIGKVIQNHNAPITRTHERIFIDSSFHSEKSVHTTTHYELHTHTTRSLVLFFAHKRNRLRASMRTHRARCSSAKALEEEGNNKTRKKPTHDRRKAMNKFEIIKKIVKKKQYAFVCEKIRLKSLAQSMNPLNFS